MSGSLKSRQHLKYLHSCLASFLNPSQVTPTEAKNDFTEAGTRRPFLTPTRSISYPWVCTSRVYFRVCRDTGNLRLPATTNSSDASATLQACSKPSVDLPPNTTAPGCKMGKMGSGSLSAWESRVGGGEPRAPTRTTWRRRPKRTKLKRCLAYGRTTACLVRPCGLARCVTRRPAGIDGESQPVGNGDCGQDMGARMQPPRQTGDIPKIAETGCRCGKRKNAINPCGLWRFQVEGSGIEPLISCIPY